jgi:hypothetical protein
VRRYGDMQNQLEVNGGVVVLRKLRAEVGGASAKAKFCVVINDRG